MNLETIPYKNYETELPQNGQHILGQMRGQNIIVYQAFNCAISDYAVKYQKFGGSTYSFSRMSWIKPNFLWMMYRAGWATKEHQERILAIEIGLSEFEIILEQAVYSSFQADIYKNHDDWKTAVNGSDVRLQWDPDHNPLGAKLQRRAIQLGMRGDILKKFANEWVVSIEDITNFVQEQGRLITQNDMDSLLVMKEQVIPIENRETIKKLKIN